MQEAAASQRNMSSLGSDPELLRDFLAEALEHLETIETGALELEQSAHNPEIVHGMFRSFHTLKGLAGFLEFQRFHSICHEVESLLELARNEKFTLSQAAIDLLLRSADFLRAELITIEKPDVEPIGHALRFLGLQQEIEAAVGAVEASEEFEPATSKVSVPEIRKPEYSDPEHPSTAVSVAYSAESTPAALTQPTKAAAMAASIKVDTSKLDLLVDSVGELVIAQSLLRQTLSTEGDNTAQLSKNLVQLARITEQLQKTALQMRMVPVGHLFQKMSRLVRDLSIKSGKVCELCVQGEQTELDRTIVELIADPIMHMIRNSVDHGLEACEERQLSGKPVVGQVRLSASHQAGWISIRVSDDGRGIDRHRVFEKAVQRGLVAPGASLTDSEVFQFIFHPGFSTAETVTDVSGRGVGMDVVKRHVQKLRGRIDIESEQGQGTTFIIKLPLTLAIIDALVVKSSTERYVLPLHAVRELIQFDPELLRTIENRVEMVLVRDSVVPLIRLKTKLGLPAAPETQEAHASSPAVLVIVETETRDFALLIDAVIGKQEVVIKSLGDFLHVPGIAGAAILGDGRVGLILDVDGLIGGGGA